MEFCVSWWWKDILLQVFQAETKVQGDCQNDQWDAAVEHQHFHR